MKSIYMQAAGHVRHYQLQYSYRFKPFFVSLQNYRLLFLKLQCFVTDYSVTADKRYK
jgi:hypothetical protein